MASTTIRYGEVAARSAVLQSQHDATDADDSGSGRALQHTAKYCDERPATAHRASELPCKQRDPWSALRVLTNLFHPG